MSCLPPMTGNGLYTPPIKMVMTERGMVYGIVLPTLWDTMGILLDVSKFERPHCFCLTGVMGIV